MLLECVRFVLCSGLFLLITENSTADGQYTGFRRIFESMDTTPLPFPTCKAIDTDCQKRGLRTFFFLMDAGHLGMKPIDPIVLDSIALSFPDHQMSLLLRRVNVTGARWTKLVERKFNLQGSKSGVRFKSDLHLTGEIIMSVAERSEPLVSAITMDIQDAESNVTYLWGGERRYDNEDYLLLGQERIAVRNTRVPTYFLQPENQDALIIDQAIEKRPAILDHIGNEIVTAVMHTVVDNFRLFASKVPVKFFYKYY